MATKIKLLRGINVTETPVSPAIADGQIIFATGDKAIYIDVGTTRHKIAGNVDTDLTTIKNQLAGIDTTVVAKITDAIADLKKTLIAEAESSETVALSLSDNTDSSAKKIKAEVKISAEAGNTIQKKNDGLFIPPAASPDTYEIEEAATPETGFAATYKLIKKSGGTGSGTQVGASINIIKDNFMESIDLVDEDGSGTAGKFIKIVFKDTSKSVIYLDVKELFNVYTTGSISTDMVVIDVNASNGKITAAITDGTVTKAKLDTTVQASLDKADSAVQPDDLVLTATEGKYVAGIEKNTDGDLVLIEKDLPDVAGLEWGTWGEASGT